MTTPDYSPFARQYARARPTYPVELFARLRSLVDRHELAWDCATGNGQAALGLADHFERVIATDISAEQIRQATPHARVEYRVAASEHSEIDDGSVDLVTVASAVHWFDLEAFSEEVRRVVRRGGVLAVWTYHVGYVDPPFDGLFLRLYREVLSEYFAEGARLVDDRYESLHLPGVPIRVEPFAMRADWTLERLLAFIASWSGTQRYIEVRGEDPVREIADDLRALWGPTEGVRTIRWPLFLRASRLA